MLLKSVWLSNLSELKTLTLPDFKLVGKAGSYIFNGESSGAAAIGDLWDEVMNILPLVGVPMQWMLGITYPSGSGVVGEMYYFAGMVVDDFPENLHGLSAVSLEGQTYLTYEHLGSMDTIGLSIEKFYGELLPASDAEFIAQPHLEIYDERFTQDESQVMRLAAPIRAS